jgi:Zn finger protein HypA/HybF involved in hydrogenase expression
MNNNLDRRCVFCGQTTKSNEWRGDTGDVCPNCNSSGNKSREQIELELMEAINDLTLAIQNLDINLRNILNGKGR